MTAAERWLVDSRKVGTTAAEALRHFQSLPPLAVSELLGHWRGQELPTGHIMDGLLATYQWHGKSFIDAETVHPLVFRNRRGERYAIDPRRIPLGLAHYPTLSHSALAAWLFRLGTPLLRTRAPRARLRLMQAFDVLTATMIYDHLPIQDSFVRLSATTLLGVKDMRGTAPFFFTLEREG
jgi:hypothetical protein